MNNTAIIVITCFKFRQAWEPFFKLFKKYWPDCPFSVYMITDKGSFDDINVIEIGNDNGFSGNLLLGLKNVEQPKIIYFQEDYFFTNYFDTKRIKKYSNYLDTHSIACLRLAPCPGPTEIWKEDKTLGIIKKGEEYRVSTQTAIWDKDIFVNLLKNGETGSEFEINGTKRSKMLDKMFLSVWRNQSPTPYYITGIVRGVWQQGALDHLQKEGIDVSDIKRRI